MIEVLGASLWVLQVFIIIFIHKVALYICQGGVYASLVYIPSLQSLFNVIRFFKTIAGCTSVPLRSAWIFFDKDEIDKGLYSYSSLKIDN